MVQNGSIWVQNNTKYENGQNSPKQSWENYLMFEYIQIFWMNIFIRKNIRKFFLGQIYSDIHSWYFYHAEYIRIFIRPISMVTNIFGYSFVQKFNIRPTLIKKTLPRLPCCQWRFILGDINNWVKTQKSKLQVWHPPRLFSRLIQGIW